MNDKTGGHGGLRRAGALAVVGALAVLATACGGSSASSSASSPTFAQEVALARCMRSHGAPNFPDPNASGGFTLNGPITSQELAAYGDCRHLLPGGPSLARVQQLAQQQQQRQAQLVPALVKFAGCVRSHGVPNFPDPTANGQFPPAALKKAGVSPQQLQSATAACQHVLPAGVQLHASAQKHPS
jgi:hypothetical protein